MYDLKEQEQHRLKNNQDEIDLGVVLTKLVSLVKSILNGFANLWRIALKRIVLLAFITAIGLGLGYLAYSVTKPFYTSNMTMVLADIRNEFVETQLITLSQMIEEENHDAIANNLDISVDAASQIKKMQFYNLDQDRIDEDSILTGSPFRIELTLYNSQLFTSMEPALANYLENNRYFAKQKRIRQRQVENMINNLKQQVASIDSVKTTALSPRGPVNGFVYGEALDPTNLYRESVGMYQQQVELEAKLERLDNIQVVNSFYPRNKPTGPNILKYLLAGGGLFFFLGLALAVTLESKASRQK